MPEEEAKSRADTAWLTPPETQALHRADRCTRIAAWMILVGTLVPQAFAVRETEWWWIWQHFTGGTSAKMVIRHLLWPLAAIASLVVLARSERPRVGLLIWIATVAYVVTLVPTAPNRALDRLLSRDALPVPVPHDVLLRAPILTLVMTIVVAASRIRRWDPTKPLLRSVVGLCGVIAVILLLIPWPDDRPWLAIAFEDRSWGRWPVIPFTVLAITALALLAALQPVSRRDDPIRRGVLARVPTWLLVLFAVIHLTSYPRVDHGPNLEAGAHIVNVIRYYCLAYGILLLLGAAWYRGLLFWSRNDPRVDHLERVFN